MVPVSYTFRAMDGPRDWGWIRERLPLKQVEDTKGIVAERDGELVAAVVFDNWTFSSVSVHQVVTTPMVLRHGFFEEVAKYVYDTCEKYQMIGLVPGDKPDIKAFDEKIGFREVARIPNGHAMGVDTIIMTMTAEQCNFYCKEEAA